MDSGWWRQMVANGYEKLKGHRTVGETADAGFQVGVQRTLAIPTEHAWRVATSADGVRAWLGDVDGLTFEEGESYRLADRSEGEVRVVRPGQRPRITWHPNGWPRPSTIQLRVVPKGENKTVISFHQEHLPGSDQREERRAHFKSALAELRELAAHDRGVDGGGD